MWAYPIKPGCQCEKYVQCTGAPLSTDGLSKALAHRRTARLCSFEQQASCPIPTTGSWQVRVEPRCGTAPLHMGMKPRHISAIVAVSAKPGFMAAAAD